MFIAEKYRPHYTYDDYCQWDGKWELIEGMPYALSPAPVPAHQRVSMMLGFTFETALQKNCKKNKTYIPLAWKITGDTIVQPDVLIAGDKIEKSFLDFPAVLGVEVLSPATAAKDRGLKMEIYQSQQVKYYLMAGPQFKKMKVYELLNNKDQPVAINPGPYTFKLQEDCTAKVSLADIWD